MFGEHAKALHKEDPDLGWRIYLLVSHQPYAVTGVIILAISHWIGLQLGSRK